MKQTEYNIIVKCIELGAKAIRDDLIVALNTVVEKAQKFDDLQQTQTKQENKEGK